MSLAKADLPSEAYHAWVSGCGDPALLQRVKLHGGDGGEVTRHASSDGVVQTTTQWTGSIEDAVWELRRP
jgi:hypothetical protein